jgi:hypothetical protein
MISVLAMLLAAPVAAAAGTAPNGWTTHVGDGYELYITPNEQVGSSELVLLVNYGDTVIDLRVAQDNQTITTEYVDARSSRFAQLDFATNGTYKIVLSSVGHELLTLNKTRTIPVTPPVTPPWDDDDWHIIPPGPSPWQPIPRPPQDPLEYTQAAVDAIVASITLEILLITASLMAISMVIGAAVQRAVRFIWPIDFITISIVAFAAVQLIGWPSFLTVPGVDPIWWIPMLVGYIIGYIVIGRTRYIMIRRLTDDKSFDTEPWVLYHIDGKPYIQEQSNKALLKRLVFGIHHPILSPVSLEPDYEDRTKYPGFPVFHRRMVCVEGWRTYEMMPETVSRWQLKRYATEVKVAYGSTVSRYELLRSFQALDRVNSRLIEAENEIYALHQSLSVRMADTVAAFLARVYSRAPGAVFKDAVERWNSKEQKEDNVRKEE